MASSDSIDRDLIRQLSVPSSTRATADLMLVWGVIAATIAAAFAVNRWYVYALAAVIIGSRQNALATLAHEAWHSLLFPSRSLNHWVGRWLYSYPLGILYYHDRTRHLRHHREVGHAHDPDWINYKTETRETPARVGFYLGSLLLGRMLIASVLSFLAKGKPRIGVEPTTEDNRTPSVRYEFACAVACQIIIATILFIATGRWWAYPLLWLFPLATFAGFFANFRSFVEHVTVDDHAPPDERLRDIEASGFTRFFVSPSHFNYHALHHAHPSIPHYNLDAGKRAYIAQLGSYPFQVWPSYARGFANHLKALTKANRSS